MHMTHSQQVDRHHHDCNCVRLYTEKRGAVEFREFCGRFLSLQALCKFALVGTFRQYRSICCPYVGTRYHSRRLNVSRASCMFSSILCAGVTVDRSLKGPKRPSFFLETAVQQSRWFMVVMLQQSGQKWFWVQAGGWKKRSRAKHWYELMNAHAACLWGEPGEGFQPPARGVLWSVLGWMEPWSMTSRVTSEALKDLFMFQGSSDPLVEVGLSYFQTSKPFTDNQRKHKKTQDVREVQEVHSFVSLHFQVVAYSSNGFCFRQRSSTKIRWGNQVF